MGEDGQKMAIVYTATVAFENSVREWISDIILENFKEKLEQVRSGDSIDILKFIDP